MCLTSTKEFWELTHIDSRARTSRLHLALGWSQALWNMFRSGHLEDENRQEDFGLFRSCVKIDSVDMLKFTYTHKSSICLVFSLTGFRFQIHIYMAVSYTHLTLPTIYSV